MQPQNKSAKLTPATAPSPSSDRGADLAPDREEDHRDALRSELRDAQARGLLRCARGLLSFEVTPVRAGGPAGRFTVPELLDAHERLVVVGDQGAGKTALVADLALRTELVPFVVPVELLEPREALTETTLARLSPVAGTNLLRRALAERRALVVVDGLERAVEGPSILLESIPAFARAHAGNRFLVATRPLRTGVPGVRRIDLPGFVTAMLLPPRDAGRVHPSYRFLGRRSPERRAALYLEQVEAHLDAWEGLPAASILGRLARRERCKLLEEIAALLHRRRSYEIPLVELRAQLERMLWSSEDGARFRVTREGERLRAPRGTTRLAIEAVPALIAEMMRPPSALVERRPGHAAFVDFALQEVLTAQGTARLAGEPSLFVEARHDRWWHGVIELAAGLHLPRLPAVSAPALVQALLDEDVGEPPDITLLAARCAEACPTLPERMRRTIDRRLGDLVPARHFWAAERLAEAGEISAPPLLRALPRSTPTERGLAALVFGRLHYEPACSALIAMAGDTAPVEGEVSWPFYGGEIDLGGDPDPPVAMLALVALFELARVSRVGRRAFGRALARAPVESIFQLCRRVEKASFDIYIGEAEPERDPGIVSQLLAQMWTAYARRGGRRRAK